MPHSNLYVPIIVEECRSHLGPDGHLSQEVHREGRGVVAQPDHETSCHSDSSSSSFCHVFSKPGGFRSRLGRGAWCSLTGLRFPSSSLETS